MTERRGDTLLFHTPPVIAAQAAAAGGSQYRDYDECEQGYLLHNFCFVYSIAVGH